jgi:FkbM family methyltransferase
VEAQAWGESDFVLIDVGASGGIDDRWSVFGQHLSGVGFDPLIPEVERLNASATRGRVRYEAALVGCRDYDRLFPPALRLDQVASRYNQPFPRSSAVAAHALLQQDYIREVFNAGAQLHYADRVVTLDDYCSAAGMRPDFLKIDTDGSDIQVLLGAPDLLAGESVLGVQIEAQFHGAVHEYANTFSNIDRLLRGHGFSLFDLQPYRYSRSALPAPFAIGVAAQTVSGQVHWGEAVYFRDLAHPAYERMFGVRPTRERLLKLCCLFELYGLGDCAAELLTSPCLADLPEREALLDLLTPTTFGPLRYADYTALFRAAPHRWLPESLAADATTSEAASVSPPPEPDTEALQAELETLRVAVEQLKRNVLRRKAANAKLRGRLEKGRNRLQEIKRLKKR